MFKHALFTQRWYISDKLFYFSYNPTNSLYFNFKPQRFVLVTVNNKLLLFEFTRRTVPFINVYCYTSRCI